MKAPLRKILTGLAGATLLLLVLATACAARAEDSALAKILDVDIPAQPLGDAVIELARQSGTQILVAAEQVKGRTTKGVRGRMSVGDALTELLAGTELEARSNGPNTISVGPRQSSPDDILADGGKPAAEAASTPPSPPPSQTAEEALDVIPVDAVTPSAEPPGHARSQVLEEIVVTANRRDQYVQDIAGSVRVLGGADLERSGAAGFADYVFKIPGADFVDDGAAKRVALRGVSNMAINALAAGATTSPIGIYLNDTPIQGNGVLPDLDLYDLERIEVLKGPQGTLYGEGAQGGAFKMLLNRADPTGFYAKGEAGIGDTYHGSGLNKFQKLALNAPLFSSWAVRLVGTRRQDQGYIDFPNRGTRGEDDATNLMGRVHLDGELWDGLSASGMLLHQRQRLEQFPTAQLAEGDLTNKNFEPQFADTDFTLGALTLDYDLGFATLTSSTSRFVNDRDALNRFPFVGAIVFATTSPVVGGDFQEPPRILEQEWLETRNHQFGIAQELRLVSSGGSWLDWVAGVFYRKRANDFNYLQSDSLISKLPPPVGPNTFHFVGVERFEQYALFGEATFKLPWNLELGLGLRGFREDVGLEGIVTLGGAFYPVAVSGGELDGEFPEKSFGIATTAITPKVWLSWFADDSRMFYLQAAKGVRSGGTNPNALASTIPPLFEPDTLSSYEIGAKTQWLDGILTANLAAFYNDTRNLQVTTVQDAQVGPGTFSLQVVLNVARAFTRGVELELAAQPIKELTLGLNLFAGEGEIVEGDPAGTIPDHTPVPQLAKRSYSAFVSYQASRWPIFGFTPSLQFDTQSTGERTPFPPPLEGIDPTLAGFQTYNALARFASERWEASFGVQNLTDERPQLGASVLEPKTLTIGRPRTWILRLGFRY